MLRNKLPPNTKSQFWIDFIDCIEEESILAKQEISKKRDLYNVEKMDYDRIVELSTTLGIPFDVSVDDSLEFLRSELLSAAFRIKWKATIVLYKSFLRAVRRQGEIYAYYFTSQDLVRDSVNLLTDMVGHNPKLPYVHRSKNNFTGKLAEKVVLDTGYKLDEGWKLDQSTTTRNTNHLAIEIFIDEIFFSDSSGLAPSMSLAPSESLAPATAIRYLMDTKYFSYVQTNAEFAKKATEVIHVGCQLTAITDASHYYDSLGDIATMPSLFLNAVTTDYFDTLSSVDQVLTMEFGIGAKTNLPSFVYGTGVQPTELAEKLAKVIIIPNEKYENSDYFGFCGKYIGNMVNDVSIGTGDGETTEFTSTLPYAPLKKSNVRVFYKWLGETRYVNDDGFGKFDSEWGQGTIDYDTGDITFSTDIFYETKEKIADGDDIQTVFTYTTPDGKQPVAQNSIFIYYVQAGTAYVAKDNGTGSITGVNCTGTINYTTGEINLTFTQPIPDGTSVNITYKYRKIMPPDNGEEILTEYYFVRDYVDITEACIKNTDGNVVAYATFPKVRFTDFYNHLSMNFILKKTSF